MSIIISSDGFIWKAITPTQATRLLGLIDLYSVHEDDSESLIVDEYDLVEAEKDTSSHICIEVGVPMEDIIRGSLPYGKQFTEAKAMVWKALDWANQVNGVQGVNDCAQAMDITDMRYCTGCESKEPHYGDECAVCGTINI